MQVYKKEATIICRAIGSWQSAALIDDTQAQALETSLDVVAFDWKKLAKYSFWVSILCAIIAVSSVVFDKVLMELLQRIFNASDSVKCLALSVLSALIYWGGAIARNLNPKKIFSNEAILFFGVLTTAGAIYELGRVLDTGSGHFSILILLSCFVYAVLGYGMKSNLVWLFALLSLGGWMGAETGYASGWGAYYLGMNYPLRFILFGGALTAGALALEKNKKFENLVQTSLVMGLLYLFVSLWILSIFGNYGDMDSWYHVKQIELFHWSLLFAIVAGGAIYHGLRFDNSTTKGFGITFLLINLYTRYFEMFWDHTHKAVFFAILAASFWALGRKAETIWNMGSSHDTPPVS